MKYPVPFGRHLLLERINVGGMAEVFKAKAFGVADFERLVAVKRILPTLAEDDEFITMFVDEARIVSHLSHQNIVQIYELGKCDGVYYISMEYVAGRDLRQILDFHKRAKKPMEVAKACYIASRVCEALEYAHRRKDPAGKDLKIIHRDVSPQNVIISFEGEVKLCDFGIAKAASRASRTQVGVLKGKFAYMSPEQVRGQATDRRSDLFALGVIFYEMLTGERLFLGESDYSTLEAVRSARVPAPTNFNGTIPPSLEKVMLKLLARDPKDRYQWASEVQEELLDHCLAAGKIYHGRHLRSWMQEVYKREIAVENTKLDEFRRLKLPDQNPPAEGDGPDPGPSSVVMEMANAWSASPVRKGAERADVPAPAVEPTSHAAPPEAFVDALRERERQAAAEAAAAKAPLNALEPPTGPLALPPLGVPSPIVTAVSEATSLELDPREASVAQTDAQLRAVSVSDGGSTESAEVPQVLSPAPRSSAPAGAGSGGAGRSGPISGGPGASAQKGAAHAPESTPSKSAAGGTGSTPARSSGTTPPASSAQAGKPVTSTPAAAGGKAGRTTSAEEAGPAASSITPARAPGGASGVGQKGARPGATEEVAAGSSSAPPRQGDSLAPGANAAGKGGGNAAGGAIGPSRPGAPAIGAGASPVRATVPSSSASRPAVVPRRLASTSEPTTDGVVRPVELASEDRTQFDVAGAESEPSSRNDTVFEPDRDTGEETQSSLSPLLSPNQTGRMNLNGHLSATFEGGETTDTEALGAAIAQVSGADLAAKAEAVPVDPRDSIRVGVPALFDDGASERTSIEELQLVSHPGSAALGAAPIPPEPAPPGATTGIGSLVGGGQAGHQESDHERSGAEAPDDQDEDRRGAEAEDAVPRNGGSRARPVVSINKALRISRPLKAIESPRAPSKRRIFEITPEDVRSGEAQEGSINDDTEAVLVRPQVAPPETLVDASVGPPAPEPEPDPDEALSGAAHVAPLGLRGAALRSALADPHVQLLIGAFGIVLIAVLVAFFLTSSSSGASLQISTEPPQEVEVWVDGRLLASGTQAEAKGLPLGPHMVELRVRGLAIYQKEIQIAEARPYALAVPVNPSIAARLRPHGTPPGESAGAPSPAPAVAPGPAPEPPARDPADRPSKGETSSAPPRSVASPSEPAAASQDGASKTVRRRATPEGFMLVTTKPTGVGVIIDGQRTNLRTPVRQPYRMTAGKHVLTFETEDGERYSFDVEIASGETTTVTKQLR